MKIRKFISIIIWSLFVTGAGAVTIDWDAWSARAEWTDLGISGKNKEFRIETGGSNPHPVCRYDGNADFALQVVFAANMTLAGSNWGDLLTVHSSGDVFRIQKTASKALAGYSDKGNGSTWTTVDTPNDFLPTAGPLTILFTYDHTNKRVALVANGKEIGYGSYNMGAWITLETGRGARPIRTKAFSDYTLESVKFSTSQIVPEPGVLSCLLLGLAGFALRRRRM